MPPSRYDGSKACTKQSNLTQGILDEIFLMIKKNITNEDDDKNDENKKPATSTAQQSQRDLVQFSTTSEEIAPATTGSTSNNKPQKSESIFLCKATPALASRTTTLTGTSVLSLPVPYNSTTTT